MNPLVFILLFPQLLFAQPVEEEYLLPKNVFVPPDIKYWAFGKVNTTVYDSFGLPWYCYTNRQTHCLPLFNAPDGFSTTRKPFLKPWKKVLTPEELRQLLKDKKDTKAKKKGEPEGRSISEVGSNKNDFTEENYSSVEVTYNNHGEKVENVENTIEINDLSETTEPSTGSTIISGPEIISLYNETDQNSSNVNKPTNTEAVFVSNSSHQNSTYAQERNDSPNDVNLNGGSDQSDSTINNENELFLDEKQDNETAESSFDSNDNNSTLASNGNNENKMRNDHNNSTTNTTIIIDDMPEKTGDEEIHQHDKEDFDDKTNDAPIGVGAINNLIENLENSFVADEKNSNEADQSPGSVNSNTESEDVKGENGDGHGEILGGNTAGNEEDSAKENKVDMGEMVDNNSDGKSKADNKANEASESAELTEESEENLNQNAIISNNDNIAGTKKQNKDEFVNSNNSNNSPEVLKKGNKDQVDTMDTFEGDLNGETGDPATSNLEAGGSNENSLIEDLDKRKKNSGGNNRPEDPLNEDYGNESFDENKYKEGEKNKAETFETTGNIETSNQNDDTNNEINYVPNVVRRNSTEADDESNALEMNDNIEEGEGGSNSNQLDIESNTNIVNGSEQSGLNNKNENSEQDVKKNDDNTSTATDGSNNGMIDMSSSDESLNTKPTVIDASTVATGILESSEKEGDEKNKHMNDKFGNISDENGGTSETNSNAKGSMSDDIYNENGGTSQDISNTNGSSSENTSNKKASTPDNSSSEDGSSSDDTYNEIRRNSGNTSSEYGSLSGDVSDGKGRKSDNTSNESSNSSDDTSNEKGGISDSTSTENGSTSNNASNKNGSSSENISNKNERKSGITSNEYDSSSDDSSNEKGRISDNTSTENGSTSDDTSQSNSSSSTSFHGKTIGGSKSTNESADETSEQEVVANDNNDDGVNLKQDENEANNQFPSTSSHESANNLDLQEFAPKGDKINNDVTTEATDKNSVPVQRDDSSNSLEISLASEGITVVTSNPQRVPEEVRSSENVNDRTPSIPLNDLIREEPGKTNSHNVEQVEDSNTLSLNPATTVSSTSKPTNSNIDDSSTLHSTLPSTNEYSDIESSPRKLDSDNPIGSITLNQIIDGTLFRKIASTTSATTATTTPTTTLSTAPILFYFDEDDAITFSPTESNNTSISNAISASTKINQEVSNLNDSTTGEASYGTASSYLYTIESTTLSSFDSENYLGNDFSSNSSFLFEDSDQSKPRVTKETENGTHCKSCHLAKQLNSSRNDQNQSEVILPGLGTHWDYSSSASGDDSASTNSIRSSTESTDNQYGIGDIHTSTDNNIVSTGVSSQSSTTTTTPNTEKPSTNTLSMVYTNTVVPSVFTPIYEILNETSRDSGEDTTNGSKDDDAEEEERHKSITLAPSYTVFGEPCRDDCLQRGYSYTWCNKIESTSTGTWFSSDYCTATSNKTPHGENCLDECDTRGYEYYWCHKSTSLWGYCTPEVLLKKAQKWREFKEEPPYDDGDTSKISSKVLVIKGYTIYGEPCVDECSVKPGSDYSSCEFHKRISHDILPNRDHCSHSSNMTSRGKLCIDECSSDEDGTHLFFCRTEGGFGFCTPDHLLQTLSESHQLTDQDEIELFQVVKQEEEDHHDYVAEAPTDIVYEVADEEDYVNEVNDDRIVKSYTVYGEPCVNECANHDGTSYTWCTKVEASFIGTWAESDYCTNHHQQTQYGENCVDECDTRGFDYFWCHKDLTLWGHCTPKHLLDRLIRF